MSAARSNCLVIGLGNPDCGDDAVGRLVARRLRDLVPPHVVVKEQDGGGAALIEALCGADCVVLVDAALTGAPPGTIHEVDCTATDALPARPGVSSHGFGVAEAIALARTLDGLPALCRLYAVEGAAFAVGAALSPGVMAAVDGLVARLSRALPHMVR